MGPASEKNRRKSLYFHHIMKIKQPYAITELFILSLEFSRHHPHRFGGALAREF